MPKHYKEMMDELINKMDEDAPANSVAGGGVDLNPTGARMSPKMMKRKKEQGDEQDKITKKISKMIKANEDNNNVILKQVNESLSKVEDKSDEKLGLKEDVTVEETKEYKTFRDKYALGKHISHKPHRKRLLETGGSLPVAGDVRQQNYPWRRGRHDCDGGLRQAARCHGRDCAGLCREPPGCSVV